MKATVINLIVGILLTGVACGPVSHPVPTPISYSLDVLVVENGVNLSNNATVYILDNQNIGRVVITSSDGRAIFTNLIGPSGFTVCTKKVDFHDYCGPVTINPANPHFTITLNLIPAIPESKIHGRISAGVDGLENNDGPIKLFGTSEFDLLFLILNGKSSEVISRLDKLPKTVNIVRVFASASILFNLLPDNPNYDDALKWLIQQTSARGIYIDLVLACDWQILYPNPNDRIRVVEKLTRRLIRDDDVLIEIGNEPKFNGWDSAIDGNFLNLATRVFSILGHKDFIIGDPYDDTDVINKIKILATKSNILSIHPNRTGGPNTDGQRLRRYIDHEETSSDIRASARTVNPIATLIINEPFGYANVKTINRDNDGECAIAAGLTGLIVSDGYVYHHIYSQDSGTPGLGDLSGLVTSIPQDCKYYNDSWSGSATKGFTWQGKVRSCLTGNTGIVVAYGLDSIGTESYVNGWHVISILYQSPDNEVGEFSRSKIKVYKVDK